MSQPDSNQRVEELGTELSMEPFREELQPLIEEVLAGTGKNKYRSNTKLVPNLVVWLVLGLTIRRELNCYQVLNWLLSGFRWL
ncbi:MAG: transposase domain-containing protein, partial [Chloroflexota bacterium]